MSTIVIVEGKEMDLKGEDDFMAAIVAITRQANDITKPESIQADYSNTITFPDTDRNRDNLGYSDEAGSVTDIPYRVLDVQIIIDGTEVVPFGKGGLQNGSFEMDVYSGNRNFFDVLGDKSIQELDLSAFNHNWNYADVVANAGNNTWQQGFVYDLYDRGKNLNLDAVDCFDLYPSVFARAIWEAIFKDAGFTYTGFTHPMFDRLLVPLNELYQFPDDYRKAREFKVTSNAPDVKRSAHADEPMKFNFVKEGFGVDTNGGYQLNNWRYVVDTPRLMSFDAGVRIGLETGSGSLEAYLYLHVNGFRMAGAGFKNPIATFKAQFLSFSSEPILVMPGDIVEVSLNISDGSSDLQADPDWYVYYSATGAETPYFSGTVLAEFPRGGIVDLAKWLPDISQKDFVKAMHSLFGMSFQSELYQDTIRIGQFADVVANIPQAIDMSARVHAPEQVRPSFKFGDFAQKNHILWKPDDTVTDGFNDGFIPVNDATLPDEKDLIKLPFAATELSRTAGVLSIPMWRAKANSSPVEYDKVKVQPRLVVQGSDLVSFTIVEYATDGTTIVSSSPGARPLAYFVDPLKAYDLSIQDYIIPAFYSTLLVILDKTKVLPVQMVLPAEFIQNWDQSIPVWVDYWQQYFYINKIEEYIDEASLTSVELIRL